MESYLNAKSSELFIVDLGFGFGVCFVRNVNYISTGSKNATLKVIIYRIWNQ